MQIDFAKLLGFNTVSDKHGLDFKDDTIGARLGAKVGDDVESGSPANSPAKGIDFQDEFIRCPTWRKGVDRNYLTQFHTKHFSLGTLASAGGFFVAAGCCSFVTNVLRLHPKLNC